MRGNVGERLRQLGRWLLGLLLLPFRLLWRALRATWRGLGQIGLWLRRQLAALLGAAWRFLGRMGLALRHLLTRFLWRPLRFITTPIRWFYGRFLRRPLAWTAKYLRLLRDAETRDKLVHSSGSEEAYQLIVAHDASLG